MARKVSTVTQQALEDNLSDLHHVQCACGTRKEF